jgi:hypothetical protein
MVLRHVACDVVGVVEPLWRHVIHCVRSELNFGGLNVNDPFGARRMASELAAAAVVRLLGFETSDCTSRTKGVLTLLELKGFKSRLGPKLRIHRTLDLYPLFLSRNSSQTIVKSS